MVWLDQLGDWLLFSAGEWWNTFAGGNIHSLSEKLDFLWWFVYLKNGKTLVSVEMSSVTFSMQCIIRVLF